MRIRLFKGFATLAGLVLLVSSAGQACAAGLRALPNHALSVVARMNLQPIGNLAGTNRLHLAIGLPLHNPAALTNLLRQLYDPASPLYHHFLTPEQFTERFGPSEQDYQAVMAFAKTNGFTVTGTYSNRMLVDVSAPVTDIEKAFHVKMRLYHHPKESRNFYAPDVAPSVPSALPVLDVSGLSDYAQLRPLFHLMPSNAKPGDGSGILGSYMGYDFRKAYVPGTSLTGSGQIVGLLQLDGYYASDIAAYEAQAGLPHVPLENVLVDGFSGVPVTVSGNGEVSLDIEMVISMAPGLSKVVVFEAPNGPITRFDDILAHMVQHPEIKQFSSSWGYSSGTPDPTADGLFLQMAAQGQSFFQASGDSDAWVDTIMTPGASPYITIVGGTTLTTTTNGDYKSETVWNWGNEFGPAYDGIGSSGGISPDYPIPYWQTNINMTACKGSTTMRNVPDVALTADNIYVRYGDGSQNIFGGTSCAAPLWAGFTALINQQAAASGEASVGFLNPLIYSLANGPHYASDFHDTQAGDNTWSGSPSLFKAVPGYDLCTGLGTPNGVNLINDLVGRRIGILQISVNPPDGAAFLQGATQPISVTVNDIYGVTNATVTAVVTNNSGIVANLTFANPANQSFYNASLSVPGSASPLTMILRATAPGEIGITNVYHYSVIGTPSNDNFANATKVPSQGGSYVENNRLATIEADEPYQNGDQNRVASLWWQWMPTVNTNVFIDTIGSKVDNVLAVYTGSSLLGLQPVAAAGSDLALYQPAQLSFNAQAGTTYYIAVAGANSSSLGTVGLNITPGGQPDTNAPVISVTSPQSGLTVVNNVTLIAGTATDPGINPSGINQVFINLNGIPLTAVGTTNWFSLLPLQPNLNVIKVSAVDRAGNVSATRTVEVNYLAPFLTNDFFVNATPLTSVPSPILTTNTTATKEVGEPNPAGNPGGKSLWWSYTPSANGTLELNTSGSSFDTIMGLYTGTNVANLTTIAENDDAYSGAPGGYSYISQAVRAGQKYYILVDGYNGASGTISLGYTFLPATVYHLTVNASGGGTVQLTTTNLAGGISIVPGTSGDFTSGSPVILTALPDHNDQFTNWSGGVNSTSNPLTVAMNGNMTITANFVARQFTDGFESGGLSYLPWVTPAPNRTNDFRWIVQSNVVDVGQFAAESWTNLMDSQSSSLILSNTFTTGTGSFDFKVSSEPNFDILSFSVDGVVVAQWSGEVGWANYSFPLTAGPHTLEWTYAKDPTISLGMDAAFLDDVDLPIGSAASPGAVQPQLELQPQPGGGLLMNLTGQTNQEYVLQSSTDLVHWQNISTNMAVGGSISVPLPVNGTNHAQFYRAVTP